MSELKEKKIWRYFTPELGIAVIICEDKHSIFEHEI